MKPVRSRFFVTLVLAFGLIPSSYAQRNPYTVHESSLSFKHQSGDSLLLKNGDTLYLKDIVSVGAILEAGMLRRPGYLAISPDNKPVYGPQSAQTVKNLFFKSKFESLKDEFRERISRFFVTISTGGPYSESFQAIHSNQGDNFIPDIATLSFVDTEGNRRSRIKVLPAQSLFDIEITNVSDSVMFYTVFCQWRNTDHQPLLTKIIAVDLDGQPLILAPGESVSVPSPFRKVDGFFEYYISLFGSTSPFAIDPLASPKPEMCKVIGENKMIDESVKRLFYDDHLQH